MRFRMIRRWGAVCPSAAVLLALSCGLTTGQDIQLPTQTPDSPSETPAVDTLQSPNTGPSSGPTTQVTLSPVDSSDADLQPIAAGEADPNTIPAEGPSPETSPAVTELIPIAEPDESKPAEIEAASFKGVVPGVTSLAEVEKTWGAPKEIQRQGSMLVGLYAVEPFKHVEVTFFEDKVTSVVIRLEHLYSAGAVATQLELTDVRPVLVSNALGEVLGQAFPERGVLFAFERSGEPGKTSTKVAQIILEPISAEPFVLRAETDLDRRYDSSLADLKQALKLQPDNARAHWLHSRVLIAMGNHEEALIASAQAVRLKPDDAQFRVTRARILGQLGRLPEAVAEVQKAVETSQQRPHVKACALCLLGDLAASGQKPDYRRAIQYHMEAVKLADTLATNRHPAVRVPAKEVLIDAHLGAAHDIAWGTWKEKLEAVTKWLSRADAFAEDLVENEGGSQEHLFRVSSRALAACVGLRGALDPGQWTTQAIQNAEQLIAATDDPVRKAQLRWDLGMALYDSLQTYQMRGDHDTALKYGEQAVNYLEGGDPLKQANSSYLLGRLYFRLGAIHAIRDENHRAAITWFEKAVPLLEDRSPDRDVADLGRLGETFVSMGVSYWETGQQERAIELTQRGIEWMEEAVQQGLLDESALAVPYSNLASMHRQMGQDATADRFEAMAKKIDGRKLR